MMPTVVVLAGGLATRLRPITATVPKSMLTVAGQPFVAHQLSLLRKNGIKKAVICSGHLTRPIEDFVGNGSSFGLSVKFSMDGERLLGTGGAIKKALPLLEEEFFVIYGDSYLTVNFNDVYNYFCGHPNTGLMTVFKNNNTWGSSNIVFKGGRILIYDKKNLTHEMEHIDYGLGILKKSAFAAMADRQAFDLSELYQDIVLKNQMSVYEVSERFYEIGSPEGLLETEKYILNMKQED